MSAQEFAEWKVYLRVEQLRPKDRRQRHAQLLAVSLQGPVKRKGGKAWLAADLMNIDVWTPPEEQARAVKPAGPPLTAAQSMAAIWNRGRK